MDKDRVKLLITKLESAGLEKVKDNLRHGRYSSWKIPYIEDWIKEKELSEKPDITPKPTADIPDGKHDPIMVSPYKIIEGILIVILVSIIIWAINHYFNLKI